jgi:hypothetical protein
MTVYLLPARVMYPIIAEMADDGVKDVAREIKHRADRNLALSRSTTTHTKLPEPMVRHQQASGVTDIGLTSEPADWGATDYLIWMEGGDGYPGAMAIEFGLDGRTNGKTINQLFNELKLNDELYKKNKKKITELETKYKKRWLIK